MPTLAFAIWPIVTFLLFARLPLRPAIVWSLMLGYMFLPEAFSINLIGLPPIDKKSIVAISLLAAVAIHADRTPLGRKNSATSDLVNAAPWVGTLIYALLALILFNGLLTLVTNLKPVVVEGTYLPAIRLWDIVSATFSLIVMVIPYMLGRRYLSRPKDHMLIMTTLVTGGLVYSALMLIEIRLSPQLNNWIYGYYQHSFIQHIRGGAFRPMVFMQHGLWVAFFTLMAILAAFSLRRRNPQAKYGLGGLWLALVLLLSHNLGATMLAAIFVPMVWLTPRWHVRIGAVVAVFFLLYPAARQAQLVPIDEITAFAGQISEERASSFQFRINNEDMLLQRALLKPLAGWGQWGRNRIHNDRGEDISTTDGLWIIILGVNGWIGYIALFGLFILPILLMAHTGRRKPLGPETTGFVLIIAANLLYVIPNSALNPIAWLIAGALAGYAQYDAVTVNERQKKSMPPRSGARYTRFLPDHLRAVTRTD